MYTKNENIIVPVQSNVAFINLDLALFWKLFEYEIS